eukprot:7092051-Pyramimonas_sp.AAC.2
MVRTRSLPTGEGSGISHPNDTSPRRLFDTLGGELELESSSIKLTQERIGYQRTERAERVGCRSRGEEKEAEELWDWACSRINSGQLMEGGPVLDGYGSNA